VGLASGGCSSALVVGATDGVSARRAMHAVVPTASAATTSDTAAAAEMGAGNGAAGSVIAAAIGAKIDDGPALDTTERGVATMSAIGASGDVGGCVDGAFHRGLVGANRVKMSFPKSGQLRESGQESIKRVTAGDGWKILKMRI